MVCVLFVIFMPVCYLLLQSTIRASLIVQLVKNLPAMQETLFNSWVRKIHWGRNRLPAPVFLDFHCDSAGKESTCNAGDLNLIPVFGRSPGEGKGYPLQYSGLENSMDCIVHGVTESNMTEWLNWQDASIKPWRLYVWNRKFIINIWKVSLLCLFQIKSHSLQELNSVVPPNVGDIKREHSNAL